MLSYREVILIVVNQSSKRLCSRNLMPSKPKDTDIMIVAIVIYRVVTLSKESTDFFC